MTRLGAGLALALVLVLAPASVAQDASPRVVSVRAARGPSVVDGAATARVVRYRSVSVTGEPTVMSGLLLMPPARPSVARVPFVVWNHMTTGAADRCAPTRATRRSSELRRMTQGDDVARRLLAAGVPVLRPDYEGIAGPGTHPYLVADSLARAVADMVRAARELEPRLGRRWVVAGHSEGGVATLATGMRGLRLPGRLVGVAAVAPATGMDVVVEALRRAPVAVPPVTGTLVALAALVMNGAATLDPDVTYLLRHGGLSRRAERLLPHLETRCLQDLGADDSWGGLAPGQVLGPRGEELADQVLAVLRRSDPQQLVLRRDVPIRIDAGIIDEVVLLPLMERMVAHHRDNGLHIDYHRWPATHSAVVTDQFAAPDLTRWILERLER